MCCVGLRMPSTLGHDLPTPAHPSRPACITKTLSNSACSSPFPRQTNHDNKAVIARTLTVPRRTGCCPNRYGDSNRKGTGKVARSIPPQERGVHWRILSRTNASIRVDTSLQGQLQNGTASNSLLRTGVSVPHRVRLAVAAWIV
jgi:hypothetical protein